MTVSDSWPILFQSDSILWRHLKNLDRHSHSYYWILIESRTRCIEWCNFQWPWVTPDPGFKVTVVFKGGYLKNDAFYRHSYCKTLIGNHRQAIECCHFRRPWLTRDPDFNRRADLSASAGHSCLLSSHSVHCGRTKNNGSEDAPKCVSCVICHSEGQDMWGLVQEQSIELERAHQRRTV